MKTITIKGRDRDIYNILRENRIRVIRHGLEITGDTEIERPSVTLAKAAAKEASKKKAVKKEDKEAASRRTKEEKSQPKTK